MISKFDLGFYLNTLLPSRKKGFSKENFINDLFFEIIYKYKIKDKNKQTYVISRELSSRLFNNKCDLPTVLQEGIKKVKNDSKFARIIFQEIQKYVDEFHFYSCFSLMCNQVSRDFAISNDDKQKYLDLLTNKDYENLNFSLFVYSCLSSNRREKLPLNKQGRPKKIKEKDGFFYLSEDEKRERAEYFLRFLQNPNNHLSLNNLHELIDIIAHYNINIDKKTMKNIALNFVTYWKKENGTSIPEHIFEYFEGAAITFPKKKKLFLCWKKPIEVAAVSIQIKKMSKNLFDAENNGDFTLASKEIYDTFFDDDYFIYSDLFKKTFIRKKFLLPDFFEHITRSEWTYCHNVATISGKMGLSKSLEDFINMKMNLSNKNNTILDRCNALIEKCKTKM